VAAKAKLRQTYRKISLHSPQFNPHAKNILYSALNLIRDSFE